MPTTRFCGICGGNHDPDMTCNGTTNVLKDAGIPLKQERTSAKKFKGLVKKANRTLIIILVITIAFIIIAMMFLEYFIR